MDLGLDLLLLERHESFDVDVQLEYPRRNGGLVDLQQFAQLIYFLHDFKFFQLKSLDEVIQRLGLAIEVLLILDLFDVQQHTLLFLFGPLVLRYQELERDDVEVVVADGIHLFEPLLDAREAIEVFNYPAENGSFEDGQNHEHDVASEEHQNMFRVVSGPLQDILIYPVLRRVEIKEVEVRGGWTDDSLIRVHQQPYQEVEQERKLHLSKRE